jgi:hypothetical protein
MVIKVLWQNETVIYDGFEMVRFRSINSEQFEKHVKGDTGFLAATHSWLDSKRSLALSMLLIAKPKDTVKKEEFIVATNCVVYLLNDEGKTIERIN